MNPSDQNPKLPMWIFFLTDAVLLGAAWYIGTHSSRPVTTEVTFAIFACIFGGALIVLVPLIARYERQKNETLDERQRALEALARTVAASAEQISIATAGLHEIVDLAQKNLRHAEQLPQKLQDKIAAFESQLTNASDSEKEELEKELLALRSSESDRLQTITDKVAKSAADWARLEAAAQQHLTTAAEALSRVTAAAAGAIGEAGTHAAKLVEAARTAALAEINAKVTGNLTPAKSGATPTPVQVSAAVADPTDAPASVAAPLEAPAPLPRAPRKPRRESSSSTAEQPPVIIASNPAPSTSAEDSTTAIAAPESPPVLAEQIVEVAAVAPNTAEPFARSADSGTTNGRHGVEVPPPASAMPKPVRKRAPKKAPPDTVMNLGIDDPSPSDSNDGTRSGVVERVITSDGATRLLVTAYIGIGNRVFIRGDGPGLTWDKGVPLQFVSIGKWRWETNDASSPVKFKLFKNDDLECAALGPQSLDPGQQQEVTAAF